MDRLYFCSILLIATILRLLLEPLTNNGVDFVRLKSQAIWPNGVESKISARLTYGFTKLQTRAFDFEVPVCVDKM